MQKYFLRNMAVLVVLSILLSMVPAMTFTAAAATVGDSFKLYANPNSAQNTNGRSYFYGVSNQPQLEVRGEQVIAKEFHWGDGIMYEPTENSLQGFNTRITIGHYETNNSSDLVAEVIYMENGIKKLSQPIGFTGWHANGRQGGTNGTKQTYDIGAYPNVVAVNVYHTMEDESPQNSTSAPYHWYVQFDVEGDAGEIVPPETEYYIENRVKSSYARGKSIAAPAPKAESPLPGPTMVPYVTPVPEKDSPVVPLGLGGNIVLFPSEPDKLVLPEGSEFTYGDYGSIYKNGSIAIGPYTLVDVAPNLNLGNGVTTIKVGNGGKISKSNSGACWSRITAGLDSALGSSTVYEPTPGLFQGVETKVEVSYMPRGSTMGLDAIITYDGGKQKTVTLNPVGNKLSDDITILDGGVHENLESVEIVMTSNGSIFLPFCIFTVVNENPGQPAPEQPKREYERPNIAPILPPAPTAPPVANAVSAISINEVCASNKLGMTDSFGEQSDWIELYNSSDSDINVLGYGLSDNPKKPYKWVLPDVVVPAKGYLTVFASGRDTVVDGEIHTNFNISKSGEPIILSDTAGGLVSVMNLPLMENDQTLARYPDGGNDLRMMVPTPNGENIEAATLYAYVEGPSFSAEGGFYPNDFDLTMASATGTNIYYTLDGSTPTTESTLFTQFLPLYNRTQDDNGISMFLYDTCKYAPTVKIDKGTVIKAIAVDGAGNTSEVVTKSYFVGLDIRDEYNNEPVLSISTDAENLFDASSGIFTKPNERGNLWETRVHLDFFEGDGGLVLNQDCAISVRGLGARGEDQKSLTFKAKGDYGESTFAYDLFQGKATSKIDGSPIQEYSGFALRGGLDGSRSNGERWIDPAMQYLSRTLDTDWQAGRPCTLFINGEYWGHYYLQEKVGVDYIEEHYNIPADDVILFKTSSGKGNTTNSDAATRDADIRWLQSANFDDPKNYELLEAKFDIPQMMRYYATNFACINVDWGGYNFAMWRSRYVTDKPYEDGKWRFMLYDLDATYINAGGVWQEGMMKDTYMTAMKKNPSLKKRLLHTLCDVYENWYDMQTVLEEFQYWHEELHCQTDNQWERWGESPWGFTIGSKYNNLVAHPKNYIDLMRRQFGVTGAYTHLNVRINDTSMGTVHVNDIPADFTNGSYTGWYFNDYTVTLVPEAKPGYQFVGWEKTEGTTLSEVNGATFVSIPDNGSRVTAIFAPDGVTEGTKENPYKISTAEDLQWMANQVNNDNLNYGGKYYVLENDITLSGTDNHVAIGTKQSPFRGTFDGQFHTIDGINFTTTLQGAGLFGYVDFGATVKNVGVINSSISASGLEGKNVGGIVGNNAGLIENCYTTGSLSGISTVGGIAGNNTGDAVSLKGGTIRNCYSIAEINSDSPNTLGGIAGKTEYGAAIVNSYAVNTLVGKVSDGGTVDSLSAEKTADEFAGGVVTPLLNGSAPAVWADGPSGPVFSNGAAVPNVTLSCVNHIISVDSKIAIEHAKLVIASYSGNQLADIRLVDFSMPADTVQTVDIPSDLHIPEGGSIKVMLWNDTEILQPLAYFTIAQ